MRKDEGSKKWPQRNNIYIAQVQYIQREAGKNRVAPLTLKLRSCPFFAFVHRNFFLIARCDLIKTNTFIRARLQCVCLCVRWTHIKNKYGSENTYD